MGGLKKPALTRPGFLLQAQCYGKAPGNSFQVSPNHFVQTTLFGHRVMKASSLFAFLLCVAWARPLWSAETNALPPELEAHIRALDHQATVKLVVRTVTDAQKNDGKLLHMVNVLDGHHTISWAVEENGERTKSDSRVISRELPRPPEYLTTDELQHLRAALAELPAGKTNIGTNETIIVGFRSGTNWLSAIYDGNEKPAAVAKIVRAANPPEKAE